MVYKYEIYIKLRTKKSFEEKRIIAFLEYVMGVGEEMKEECFNEFMGAKKLVSIGITKKGG